MKILLTTLVLLVGMNLQAQEATAPIEEASTEIAETKPRYYSESCETIKNLKEKMTCADSELIKKMYRTMTYPASARKNGVSGMVVLSYVVKSDGTLGEVKVMRSVSPELDATAIKGLRSVGKWIPGTQNGEPKDVTLTMPVKFML